MNPKHILLLGLKGTVLAFHRETGERLWTTLLKSSSSDFVVLASDDSRVYAHTGGEIFCLDLQTGQKLWQDGLKGLGYGIASLAFAGSSPLSPGVVEVLRQQAAAASATAANAAT